MTTTHMILPNPWGEKNSLSEKAVLAKTNSFLLEELFKIAARELREDEATRRQCLSQLREWIQQNRDIENCIIDDNFLLRFLRVKKFSIPMAQQGLLKYLNFRKRFKNLLCDLDYLDPDVNEVISNGYIYASPIRDNKGRRVVICNLSKFDPHRFTNITMTKAHMVTYETLLCDEENQILGINHVADVSGCTPAFITLFSINEFATLVKWGEQSFPMRHKEINLLNVPAALRYVYNFAVSRLSPKLRERVHVHESMSDLINQVDKRCLTTELGGDLPSSTVIQLWKEELAQKRERLLSYEVMNLLSDAGITTRRNTSSDQTGIGSVSGSFRKLELD